MAVWSHTKKTAICYHYSATDFTSKFNGIKHTKHQPLLHWCKHGYIVTMENLSTTVSHRKIRQSTLNSVHDRLLFQKISRSFSNITSSISILWLARLFLSHFLRVAFLQCMAKFLSACSLFQICFTLIVSSGWMTSETLTHRDPWHSLGKMHYIKIINRLQNEIIMAHADSKMFQHSNMHSLRHLVKWATE